MFLVASVERTARKVPTREDKIDRTCPDRHRSPRLFSELEPRRMGPGTQARRGRSATGVAGRIVLSGVPREAGRHAG